MSRLPAIPPEIAALTPYEPGKPIEELERELGIKGAIKLASNQRVVCGTPAYFRKRGKPRTLDDLRHHNCLAFNLQGGQQRGWYFEQDGKTVTVRVEGNLDCGFVLSAIALPHGKGQCAQ